VIAGGAVLVAGVLSLLLLVPAGVWAARENARPLGLGGLILGLGGGITGLIVIAAARCDASNVSGPDYVSECVAPDVAPYLVVAAALAVIGVGVSLVGVARGRTPAI
jgi:hypothetical protein